MADDPELARWRAERMAQMQSGASVPNATSQQEVEQQRRKKEVMEEKRRLLLKQILLPAAAEKLANVKLVKPERAAQVETYVINAAQSGQLPGKVTEEQLQDLLRQVSEQNQKTTKVTISRRRMAFDSDDDDDDDDF